MADKTLIATHTGDWGTVANWLPVNVPVNADNVFLENSAVAITLSLNQAAVTLGNMDALPSWTGNIGSGAGSLIISAARFLYRGTTGSCYWASGTAASSLLVVDTTNVAANAFVLTAGTVAVAEFLRGNSTVNGGTQTTTRVGYPGVAVADCIADLNGTNATVILLGGAVTLHNSPTVAVLNLGAAVTWVDAAGTCPLYQQFGGTCLYNPAAASVLTKGEIYGGTFTSGTRNGSKTIVNLDVHPGATVDLRNRCALTNGPKNYGGTIQYPSGYTTVIS